MNNGLSFYCVWNCLQYECQFFSKRRIISGMVIASLSWCRGEWVDYTFAANLAPCVLNILRKKHPCSPVVNSTYENADGLLTIVIFCYYLLHPHVYKVFLFLFIYLLFYIAALDRGVVLVRCGISWGTGILVDKDTGIFLTCSHVVAEVIIRIRNIILKIYNTIHIEKRRKNMFLF